MSACVTSRGEAAAIGVAGRFVFGTGLLRTAVDATGAATGAGAFTGLGAAVAGTAAFAGAGLGAAAGAGAGFAGGVEFLMGAGVPAVGFLAMFHLPYGTTTGHGDRANQYDTACWFRSRVTRAD